MTFDRPDKTAPAEILERKFHTDFKNSESITVCVILNNFIITCSTQGRQQKTCQLVKTESLIHAPLLL